jgi:dihydroorotate dehydrogenase
MSRNQPSNYDYELSRGDKFLKFVKKALPNPEVRHDKLSSFAKWAAWFPRPRVDRSFFPYVLKFTDRSNPLYLGSPIVLAAGANKFGENIADFAKLGFGAVTVGTATRQHREGNPFRPRIRMVEEDRCIQNSMGLNNPGIDPITKIVDRDLIQAHKNKLCVGISISETPGLEENSDKLEDVLYTFRAAYNAADYVEINVSCPNTGHDRIDSQMYYLDQLMSQIMKIRKSQPIRKAVFAKLSPDMGEKKLHKTLDIVQKHGLNGVILFNTFPGAKVKYLKLQEELEPVTQDGALGGISGRALYVNTVRAVAYIKNKYPGLCVIASGGVDHGAKIWDLFEAGADVVQVYSVLGYRWFGPIKMLNELEEVMRKKGYTSLEEFFEKRFASM